MADNHRPAYCPDCGADCRSFEPHARYCRTRQQSAPAQHTPGPWHNEKPLPTSRTASAVICGAPPSCVPHIAYIPMNGYGASLNEQAANARLISAAPDLLAALKKTRHVIDTLGLDPVDGNYTSVLEQADIAIAKAEGR
jgi:hypothetical protein